MKKILCFVLGALIVFTLACCKTEDDKKEEIIKLPVQSEAEVSDQTETKSDEKANKIELDIKPLGEVDEKELSLAAKLFGFENPSLFHAFANAIGKSPKDVTQKDIDDVHYIAIGPEDGGKQALYVGHIDYVDLCMSEAATQENILEQLNELVMMSYLEYSDGDSFADLNKFKNVEMFEIYDINVGDVSFVANYDKLIFGYFRNNGITNLSPLSDYNPESLAELDFTGNNISDWSPVMNIKDKVLVSYNLSTGISVTLEEHLEKKNNPEPESDSENEPSNETPVFVDKDGNPVDFGSLFE